VSEWVFNVVAAIVTAIVSLFGGAGGVIWYLNQRAEESHDSKENFYERRKERLQILEEKIQKQHDKIVEQGRMMSNLHERAGEARAESLEKQGRIKELKGEVQALRYKLQAVEDVQSDPFIGGEANA